MSLKYFKWPWEVLKSGFAWLGCGEGVGYMCFSFIYVEYNWHWSVTATRNFQAFPRQKQLHWRPVQCQKKSEHDSFRRTAESGGNVSRSPFTELGDRDKKVSPSSATATKFKMSGGRYRRPQQKSFADFGNRDFGKFDKKVQTLSPKSARVVRGMVQPSIDSFWRANKRFQFSLLCRLLTTESLTIVKHEQRARFLKSQLLMIKTVQRVKWNCLRRHLGRGGGV